MRRKEQRRGLLPLAKSVQRMSIKIDEDNEADDEDDRATSSRLLQQFVPYESRPSSPGSEAACFLPASSASSGFEVFTAEGPQLYMYAALGSCFERKRFVQRRRPALRKQAAPRPQTRASTRPKMR